MKLKELIAQFEKARAAYIEKHGIEPSIYCFDEDEGLQLCSEIVRRGIVRTYKKPYYDFPEIKITR